MANVGERNRFSRWRRLPPVFRSGEHKLPGYEDETQRLTLYLPGSLLDLAQLLADLDGHSSIQDYCAVVLARSLEEERVRRKVARVEAQRGSPLKGLDEIAEDAGYLSEWQARRDATRPHVPEPPPSEVTVPLLFLTQPEEAAETDGRNAPALDAPVTVRLQTGPRPDPVVGEPADAANYVPEDLDGLPMDIVWKHVGPEGGDPRGFLPLLRRGESVPAATVAELLEALRRLEKENRGAAALARRLAYALHRLALESQVLLTEAWPGAFDEPTVEAIRAVQEMVERTLSGEVVRDDAGPESQAPGSES
ncbi:hypothetical protein [Planctomyces sp. SH-PL62]|uniref:hypothetical protein n=1 Tax=Planctomyces sp. SH-PL62 TaxID=1636152 RepID=UPI00078C87A0|nr:hypothetical protein [Planctomyces sp. SH-PL62]AMV39652.1 hypothetical protein VT85_19610 [Planctomyces sp. SH-PL62]